MYFISDKKHRRISQITMGKEVEYWKRVGFRINFYSLFDDKNYTWCFEKIELDT